MVEIFQRTFFPVVRGERLCKTAAVLRLCFRNQLQLSCECVVSLYLISHNFYTIFTQLSHCCTHFIYQKHFRLPPACPASCSQQKGQERRLSQNMQQKCTTICIDHSETKTRPKVIIKHLNCRHLISINLSKDSSIHGAI